MNILTNLEIRTVACWPGKAMSTLDHYRRKNEEKLWPMEGSACSYEQGELEPLPETADLPSAKMFAKCILSDTWQTSSFPSAAKNTLGKIMALGKQTLCRVLKKHSQNRDTRQKTATWTSISYCVRRQEFDECFKEFFGISQI